MRLCLMVTVAAVALTACTNAANLGPDSDNEGETAGNTALFCRAWPEAKRTVIDMLEGEDQRFQDARNAAVVDDTMATYDRAVPSEIRTEWDRFYDTYTRASDLTFTVGYAGHTIRAARRDGVGDERCRDRDRGDRRVVGDGMRGLLLSVAGTAERRVGRAHPLAL